MVEINYNISGIGISKSWRYLLPFLLTVISIFLHGCQSKTGVTSPPPTSTSPGKYRSAPTQRPYVINNVKYYPIPSAQGYKERGIASWYGEDFHGKSTANGETYNMYAKTAAHKILPMQTMLRVKNLDNGKEVIVRVNDRGPFINDRIIDLSYSAAHELGIAASGIAPVQIIALEDGNPRPRAVAGGGQAGSAEPSVYYIQVGSFSNRDNARQVAGRLALLGQKGVIQQITSQAQIVYRVLVYAGTSLGEARGVEAGLSDAGFAGSFVITR